MARKGSVKVFHYHNARLAELPSVDIVGKSDDNGGLLPATWSG